MERWLVHPKHVTPHFNALMLEPPEQGKGPGKRFLNSVQEPVAPDQRGTIVLDCWAGNGKLRELYARAGFLRHGVFPTSEGYDVAVLVTPPSLPTADGDEKRA